jgi:hypothetical protein
MNVVGSILFPLYGATLKFSSKFQKKPQFNLTLAKNMEINGKH